jgi:alpha-amylase/alpha-mannosidase (GH57 family)
LERFICIHGHFYQPPRENPWLEAIELQDSAYPYHDWNERITAECYAPNGASRILDADNRIDRIVNNYSGISFNFGPTLLAWMEVSAPQVYRQVIAADRESQRNFSGHGSAIAQVYNHMILPLASGRDKRTQVLWGIRDFESHFGRKPEGMWLAETAVNIETLETLAAADIRFTVLSPHQAARTRLRNGRAWRDVKGGRVDPSMAYLQRLPSGRTISLFFYDEPISRAVAFENLLDRGENLAHRLAGAFSDSRSWPQLVHMATDGETYGHHRRHADMALAYALHYIEANNIACLTNYAEFLEKHPPTHEVQIVENSSWSCVHGVERWRCNCGCNSGGHGDWNQDWRGPLREALDWLRDRLVTEFETRGSKLFVDPWQARDAYIDVVLDRSRANVDRFFQEQARMPLSRAERITALRLLELQRHAMLMYTSCGWFFDELSGIETVQVIQYAARALQLAEALTGDGIEQTFLDKLELAKSNIPDCGDGRRIFEKFVRPAIVDLQKVAAHYAISSLFEDYGEETKIYCYTVRRDGFRLLQEGKARLALGKVRITSEITEESDVISFGVLHLGDQNLYGGVRIFGGEAAYKAMSGEAAEVFRRGDIPELIRAVDRNFGRGTFSLRYLFRDEQRRIVNNIVDQATAEASALNRSFYLQYGTLIRFVADLGIPLSPLFQMAVDFTLQEEMLAALSQDQPDLDRIEEILEQTKQAGITLDQVTLEFTFRRTVDRSAQHFQKSHGSLKQLRAFENTVGICASLPFEVNLWVAQNIYFEVIRKYESLYKDRAAAGDSKAQLWLATAASLGEKLYVNSKPLAEKARA